MESTLAPCSPVAASPAEGRVLGSAEVIAALAALAQEHRLAAFRLLVEAGPDGVSAGDLADRLNIPRSSLSFHLNQMMQAGLIVQRRESRSLIYSADFAAMAALVGFLTENCCRGAGC
ncbi:MAG: transcriptional regulator [Sphingomonadales bacterium RIFCSPHIGHO2_01_FULL_65_20]|jgi:DNA-binding transcriptional ArsR family regulator|uniref:ArsR/SmtB family transcription factor n=1 Tax=unclassified Blastomonas TaxID=2626550 RepID=UPI00082AE69A|nr:winged helix-turn-helix transcriptional regulator [Blastomonas sp.]MCH2236253.1 metalloregulator ArsR/SmtB family transcription factor [Blastomonas sp.]OHC94750.1 MAG: transcriptional regulator [Sphingomonadales bacterium RIFCSPHIGHO2_01_FULL_65_20]